jgi:glycosyltransferase involved in cell wall biosynthesis
MHVEHRSAVRVTLSAECFGSSAASRSAASKDRTYADEPGGGEVGEGSASSRAAALLCVSESTGGATRCWGDGHGPAGVPSEVHWSFAARETTLTVELFGPVSSGAPVWLRQAWNISGTSSSAAPANVAPAPLLCVLSLVLNGMPFLAYHAEMLRELESKHGVRWRWVAVEGPAAGRAHRRRPYSRAPLPRTAYRQGSGESVDGSAEFLDELSAQWPGEVQVLRPSASGREQWEDKLEMANEGTAWLLNRPDQPECSALLQLDADELWSADALAAVVRLMTQQQRLNAAVGGGSPACAYLDCHFFIAPELVTVSRGPGVYSHDDELEWLRVWRVEPDAAARYMWVGHAPPRLARWDSSAGWTVLEGRHCLQHGVATSRGAAFSHHAYSSVEQVRFKGSFYGYDDAEAQWAALQRATPPVDVGRFLGWVERDKGLVARGARDPVMADHPERSPIAPNVPVVSLAMARAAAERATQWFAQRRASHRARHIVVDFCALQLQRVSGGGILRLWSSLLPPLAAELARGGHRLSVLVRGGGGLSGARRSAPDYAAAAFDALERLPGVTLVAAPPYDASGADGSGASDATLLAGLCARLRADAFVSTMYSSVASSAARLPGLRHVLLVHDMIPEELGWDLSLPEWRAKHRALAGATSLAVVSGETGRALRHWLDASEGEAGRGRTIAELQVAVDLSLFRPLQPPPAPAEEPAGYVLLVGPRAGYKGGAALWQSAPALCQAWRARGLALPARVVLAGGGPLSAEERATLGHAFATAQHELGACLAVRSLGRVADAVLARLYAHAGALAYLSLREGFGLPVAEALASGCPVVLLRSNAASVEAAGGVAHLVEVQAGLGVDPDSLARAVVDAVAEPAPLRAARTQRGLARARALFGSWQPAARVMAGLLLR